MSDPVYLNHAGTSWPKPLDVQRAAADALAAPVADWPSSFERAHQAIADFFGAADRARLLLTPGCTSALAAGVHDLAWQPGDRALMSAMEHHALHRPLHALQARGIGLDVLPRATDGPLDLDALEAALKAGGVRLVAFSGAANVTGERLPLEEAIALAHRFGALVLVDAAQLAGWAPVDVRATGVDLLAFAGHKALQGTWGIGGLYVAPHVEMTTPLEGVMPGYCDTGSVDRVALAALEAGLDWLAQPARALRLARALDQLDTLREVLRAHEEVRVLGTSGVPTLAFVLEGAGPAEVASAMRARGVVVSGGHQCAPLAHRHLGTGPSGAVRLSVGATTSDDDIARARAALEAVLEAQPWRS